jgi:hypothetical protein
MHLGQYTATNMRGLGWSKVLLLSIHSTLTNAWVEIEEQRQISLIDEKPYLSTSVEVRLPPSMTPDFDLNDSWTGPPEVSLIPERELHRLENPADDLAIRVNRAGYTAIGRLLGAVILCISVRSRYNPVPLSVANIG